MSKDWQVYLKLGGEEEICIGEISNSSLYYYNRRKLIVKINRALKKVYVTTDYNYFVYGCNDKEITENYKRAKRMHGGNF